MKFDHKLLFELLYCLHRRGVQLIIMWWLMMSGGVKKSSKKQNTWKTPSTIVTVNKDRLPKSLKSSTSSDDPKIGHSNASKERSSKRTGEKLDQMEDLSIELQSYTRKKSLSDLSVDNGILKIDAAGLVNDLFMFALSFLSIHGNRDI
ncbi:Hypothetical predicted protein [Olea europaea subsp. europaea]|uniref:Uncharacterized protein n=1 Tax=Olea europaea subsp. europaea TaxID=158383 RepID=A0A8S0PTG8_OLEEU|nr:Hypothetical predicted protein [Olea europaea subsp. europaea]